MSAVYLIVLCNSAVDVVFGCLRVCVVCVERRMDRRCEMSPGMVLRMDRAKVSVMLAVTYDIVPMMILCVLLNHPPLSMMRVHHRHNVS